MNLSTFVLFIVLASVPPAFSGWTLLSKGPWAERCALKVAVFNGEFYLTGGRTLFDFFGDVWKSKNGTEWTLLTASAPWGARAYHQLVVKDGYLWLMGGQNLTVFYNDIWRTKDGVNWEFFGVSPWKGRAGFKALVVKSNSIDGTEGKELFVVTGGSYNNFLRKFFNDVWLSENGKNWTCVNQQADWRERAGLQVLYFPSNETMNLFVLGGEHGFAGPYFNDIWQSANLGKNWTLTTPAAEWSKRSGHLCTVSKSSMYCIGGFYGLHDVWRSDDGRSWKKVDDKAWNCNENKCSKFDFDIAEINGTIYTFGGDHEVTLVPGPQDNEVWSYNPNPQEQDDENTLVLTKK